MKKFIVDLTGRLVDIVRMSSRTTIRRTRGVQKNSSTALTEEYNILLDSLKSVTAALDTSKDMYCSSTLKASRGLVEFWDRELYTLSLVKERTSKLWRTAIKMKHVNLELVYANLATHHLDKGLEPTGKPSSLALITEEELEISQSPTLGSSYVMNEDSPRTPIVKLQKDLSRPVSTIFGGRAAPAKVEPLGRLMPNGLFQSRSDPPVEALYGSTDTTPRNIQ